MELSLPTPAIGAIRRALLNWYRKHARDLPWRHRRDAYAIWVSEIMLQQTRVETVVDYYDRFLAAFPDCQALALAEPDRLLRAWEGMGYYNRATRLQQAARLLLEHHDGQFPRDPQQAAQLPGVGEYTVGAVLSMAYGIPLPAVDGNVGRVLSRLTGSAADPAEREAKQALTRLAGRLLSRKSPGEFNQALIEVGALVCTGRSPACSRCPLTRWCKGYRVGDPTRFPARPRAASKPVRHALYALIHDDAGNLLVRRRPVGKLWSGLYELPGLILTRKHRGLHPLVAHLRESCGVEVLPQERRYELTHVFTHFTLHLHVYPVRLLAAPRRLPENVRWASPEELVRLPFPVPLRAVLRREYPNVMEEEPSDGSTT